MNVSYGKRSADGNPMGPGNPLKFGPGHIVQESE